MTKMRLVRLAGTTRARVSGTIGVKVSSKLGAILNKNPGYGTLKSRGVALEGKSPTINFSAKFLG